MATKIIKLENTKPKTETTCVSKTSVSEDSETSSTQPTFSCDGSTDEPNVVEHSSILSGDDDEDDEDDDDLQEPKPKRGRRRVAAASKKKSGRGRKRSRQITSTDATDMSDSDVEADEVFLRLMREQNELLRQQSQQLTRLTDMVAVQNSHLKKLVTNSRLAHIAATSNGSEADPTTFMLSLTTAEQVLNDSKWLRPAFVDNRQNHINALTCDLASRVIFGDDVLKASNVSSCDARRRLKCLSAKKLLEIKSLVSNAFYSGAPAPVAFDVEEWPRALQSLQTRCKNLRCGAVRTLTASTKKPDADLQ